VRFDYGFDVPTKTDMRPRSGAIPDHDASMPKRKYGSSRQRNKDFAVKTSSSTEGLDAMAMCKPAVALQGTNLRQNDVGKFQGSIRV
jgi:hypothetical protein